MEYGSQYDREEEQIGLDYDEGRISLKERDELLRELRQDYRWQAEEAAQEAYDREMNRW